MDDMEYYHCHFIPWTKFHGSKELINCPVHESGKCNGFNHTNPDWNCQKEIEEIARKEKK